MVKLGLQNVEIIAALGESMGIVLYSYPVHKWVTGFKKGQADVEDEARSSRTSTSPRGKNESCLCPD